MSSNATRGVKCWCRLVQLMVQQVWENRWRFWCILVGCTWCVCWPCVCWPWLCPRPQERSEDVAACSRPWGRTDLFTDDRRTVLERSRRKDQRLLRSSIVTECFHVHFIKDCVEVTVQRLHTDNRGSPLLTSTGSVGRNEAARPIRLQRETTLVTWSFCLFFSSAMFQTNLSPWFGFQMKLKKILKHFAVFFIFFISWLAPPGLTFTCFYFGLLVHFALFLWVTLHVEDICGQRSDSLP